MRLRDVTCYLILMLFSTDPKAVYTSVCHSNLDAVDLKTDNKTESEQTEETDKETLTCQKFPLIW